MSRADAMGFSSISEAVQAIRTKTIRPTELLEETLAACERLDPEVGAFLRIDDTAARAAARAVEVALANGRPAGRLAGVPIGVKDVIRTRDGRTGCQSRVLLDHPPFTDAAAVARLRAEGAVIVGKLTTMECGLGITLPEEGFPVPSNPWDMSRWAGGSSSGCANSVAAGMLLGSVGSDTGGSVRIPASYCGITGMAPTHALVDSHGLIPVSPTLDRIGPLARTAQDCELMLRVLSPTPLGGTAVPESLPGVRIAYSEAPPTLSGEADASIVDAFRAALDVLAGLGAELVPAQLPLYDELTQANEIIARVESIALHGDPSNLGQGMPAYSLNTTALLTGGMRYSAEQYEWAIAIRERVRRHLRDTLWDNAVAHVMPTVGSPPPHLEAMFAEVRERGTFTVGQVYTPYWSASGDPVLTVPMGPDSSGLPTGLQIASRAGTDLTALSLGALFQRATSWHLLAPAPAT